MRPVYFCRQGAAALSLLLVAACGEREQTAPATRADDGDRPITVYAGGTIYTGGEAQTTVEAVAVSKGEILATGARDIVEEAAGPGARFVDLQGAYLYPGFTDAHAHLLGIGMRELILNLEGASSIADLVERVETALQNTNENAALYGRGWIETGWPEGRMPTRDDLDPVSEGRPVILERADGHAVIVNSAALDAAGVDQETPDPEGGRIERNDEGRATGLLIDNAAGLVAPLIAAPSEAMKREAYAKASEVYAAYGWTGVHNMSVDPADLDLIERLSDAGEIKIRVYNSIDKSGLAALAENGPRGSENGRVATRAVKLYVDGALGSRGAALAEPYADAPETSGLLLMREDEALRLYETAIANGVQIATHAIGDRGNALVLDWYAQTFANHPGRDDFRWRVEHAQILNPDDIDRFAKLGVIASMQPSHAIGDLFFAPDRLGTERLDGAYAWRSILDAGGIIAGGSDAPVERGDPRIEFYAAVARMGLDGYSDENWRPGEKVSRKAALAMFTAAPAYAAFAEDALGTIEPGKRADFTVFGQDIMAIAPDAILTVRPLMTVVDGEVIFAAPSMRGAAVGAGQTIPEKK